MRTTPVAIALTLVLILLGFMSFAFSPTSFADEIILTTDLDLEDETSCLDLGGVWQGSSGCEVDADTSVIITSGVTLTVWSNLSNEGVIQCFGTIDGHGDIVNQGTIVVETGGILDLFYLVNHGELKNAGLFQAMYVCGGCSPSYFVNHGFLDNTGTVINQGIMEVKESAVVTNEGNVEIAGVLFNLGHIENLGGLYTINAPGIGVGLVSNEGTIDNRGVLHNCESASGSLTCRIHNVTQGMIHNFAHTVNGGTFQNDGVLINMCSATYTGNPLQGNTVEQMVCSYLPTIRHGASKEVADERQAE